MALICDACSKPLQLKTFCEECYLNAHKRLNDMEMVANSKESEIQILKDEIEERKLGAKNSEQKIKSQEKAIQALELLVKTLEATLGEKKK